LLVSTGVIDTVVSTDVLDAVLKATPLFWPGVICSLFLAAVLSGRAGRLLLSHRAVGFLLVLALGGVVALTLLPDLRGPLWENARYAVQQCALDNAGPRPFSALFTATQSSLNVALFIPLGLAAGLAGTRGRAALTALGAATLPFAVEWIQYLSPFLGRACDAQDVWDNLFGLAIGLVSGLAAGPMLRTIVRGLRARAA
jgi:hypothetical protein